MILSALSDYYSQLLSEGEIPEPGWSPRRVMFVLELSEDGKLQNVVASSEKRGTVTEVPEQVKRASGIAANFLCDTSSYLLGIDSKDKPERAMKCFQASRELHHSLLDGVDSDCAHAILSFFDCWNPGDAPQNEALQRTGDEIFAGGMITFVVVGADGSLQRATEDVAIRFAWNQHCSSPSEDEPVMTCLVTGKHGPIARLHPSIKGVVGAQSSGATLVGFNAPSFESYGHTVGQGQGQGCNAPVSVSTARAYGAALNYLLADPGHRVRLGNTTVVFWSEKKDRENSLFFCNMFNGSSPDEEDADAIDKQISVVLKGLASGQPIAVDNIDLDARFYVLGLAPNASRLSVRFFLRDSFGRMLRHAAEHYDRLSLAHRFGPDRLTPRALLNSVENEHAKGEVVSSVLMTGLLCAILDGGRYPEALYGNALLRVRSTREVTYERASLIKAFLLRNRGYTKEELTVDLNEQSEERAYSLGRTFAVLEQIQRCANSSVTITSRYLDSASTMPSLAFPVLLRLSNKHLAKIERDKPGLAAYFSRLISELLGRGGSPISFPPRLSLDEQGSFLLGYYQQKWRPAKTVNEQDGISDSDVQEA